MNTTATYLNYGLTSQTRDCVGPTMQLPMPKALAWFSELLRTMLSGSFSGAFDDRIAREYATLPIVSDRVWKEGLQFIAGKI